MSMEAAGAMFFVALWTASVVWTIRDAGRRCSDPSLQACLCRRGDIAAVPRCRRLRAAASLRGSARRQGPARCVRRCSKPSFVEAAERCPSCAVPLEPEFRLPRRVRRASPHRMRGLSRASSARLDRVPVVCEAAGRPRGRAPFRSRVATRRSVAAGGPTASPIDASRRIGVLDPPLDQLGALEVFERERERARGHARQRGAQLGESSRLRERDEDGQMTTCAGAPRPRRATRAASRSAARRARRCA